MSSELLNTAGTASLKLHHSSPCELHAWGADLRNAACWCLMISACRAHNAPVALVLLHDVTPNHQQQHQQGFPGSCLKGILENNHPIGWLGCNCASSSFCHQVVAHLKHHGSFSHSTGWVLGPCVCVWASQEMPKVVQRNRNIEEDAGQKSAWRVSQCLSFETSGRSHSLPPCQAYVLLEDVALKSPWVEEGAELWMSCYGRKEDLWTPTWVSLMDRLNPGSVVRCCLMLSTQWHSSLCAVHHAQLAQLQAVEKEEISDASDITSGWGIFGSNLVSRVLLGS